METAETVFSIRPAYADEYETVMRLVWRTFLKYEAQDYTRQGVKSFQDFITNQSLKKLYDAGQYPIFVATMADRIIGMISLRCRTHISLLFVDERYHRRGVGRSLMECACTYIAKENGGFRVTVDASPYAVGFYHKLGFVDMKPEQFADGVRYTPMSLLLFRSVH